MIFFHSLIEFYVVPANHVGTRAPLDPGTSEEK